MDKLNKLFKDFNKTKRSDWVEAATKDLKDKTVDSLNYSYYDTTDMPAAVFPEDVKQRIGPILWKKNIQPELGIYFNEEILSNKSELEVLIHLNVNNFLLKASNLNAHFYQKLNEEFPYSNWLLENQNALILPDSQIFKFHLLKSNQLKSLDQVIEMMKKGKELLKATLLNDEDISVTAKNIYFLRKINNNYLYEIALGRAQRIVWRNLLKVFSVPDPLPPLFNSILNVNDDENLCLIEATSKMLSAFLGGADQVFIEMNKNSQRKYLNNLVHIFNILKMESGIGEVMDPAAGSYYLDELTTKLANIIWENLKS